MESSAVINEISRALNVEIEALIKMRESLNVAQIKFTVQAINNCKGKIILSGCGTSAMAARKIAHSLCCIDIPAVYISPSDAVHGGLGVVQAEDVVIMISKGGNTKELLNMIPACKIVNSFLIGVTENPESELSLQSDIQLIIRVPQEACKFNMLATSSTLAVISVFDAICIALMELRGFTKKRFAVIHPNGAVGERLNAEQPIV